MSDDSILIRLGESIDPDLTARIAALCIAIESQHSAWVTDVVPSYTTVLVSYDPSMIDFRRARQALVPLLHSSTEAGTVAPARSGTVHEIPVYYAPESGPDLQNLAYNKSLSVAKVIQYHTAVTYQVFAIGFLPGFGFLGSVAEAIATPRRQSPRKQVPAGSVGIANQQTAIYPKASPGGWQLIGRSPVTMFDVDGLSRLKVGDGVRFHAVSRSEYLNLGGTL
ncbi:5-oxoprolinase subunit PxpB [Marinobacter sp. SS21]|uniref:5-oxoprolinase subunit PxpB n=1 Tax=Marinobacter sp. SS21 TaxID=2979460 RepID=UPI002FEE20B9